MKINREDELELLWRKVDIAVANADHQKVVQLLKRLVKMGVWQAAARVGEIYELGATDVDVNLNEAVTWYRRAVFECDDPIAHLGLGRIYFEGGLTIEKDIAKTREHLIKAYERNIPEAGIFLGLMCIAGLGYERNVVDAERFFLVAARAGFPVAYHYLADLARSSGRIRLTIGMLVKGFFLEIRLKIQDRNHPNLWRLPK